jgi:hypothetical protein
MYGVEGFDMQTMPTYRAMIVLYTDVFHLCQNVPSAFLRERRTTSLRRRRSAPKSLQDILPACHDLVISNERDMCNPVRYAILHTQTEDYPRRSCGVQRMQEGKENWTL